jgi:hypothetical protein
MKRENGGLDPAILTLMPPTIWGVLRSTALLKENSK